MPSLINLKDVTVNQRLYDILESLFRSWGGIGEQGNDSDAYIPKALKGYKNKLGAIHCMARDVAL